MRSSSATGFGMTVVAILLMLSGRAAATDGSQMRFGTHASEVIVSKITVSNLHRSLDFYTRVVGLKEFRMLPIPRPDLDDPDASGMVYLNFSGSPADPFLCLVKQKGLVPTPESARLTWVGFKVVNTRAAVDRAKAAGVSVVLEPTEFMGTVGAAVRDPDGYMVDLVQAHSVKGRVTK